MNTTNTGAERPTRTEVVSITALLNAPEIEGDDGQLDVLRLGTEAVFISVFTEQAVQISAHWLEATETWTKRGYIRCLNEDCPACRAGLERKSFLLLPVVDRLDGRVKVLQIPQLRGAGRLLTELGPVLSAPDREKLIIRIARDRSYTHSVAIQSDAEIDPEVARAAQVFVERLDTGLVDPASAIPALGADELASHERIAKRLQLMG